MLIRKFMEKLWFLADVQRLIQNTLLQLRKFSLFESGKIS